MEYVATNNAPGAIGPYSQAVKANGFLFTSGQIAINPATNTVEAKTIEEQTTQVCENLKAVVEAAGTAMDKVVKTVCFLADINVQRDLRRIFHIKAGSFMRCRKRFA